MKIFKITTSLLLILLSPVLTYSPARAAEVLFTEDFSQGLVKWQPVRDDGSMWQIANGAAEAYVGRRSTVTELALKDEYWHADWKNLEYQLEFTPIQGADKNISFKFNNLKNWYELHFVNNSCDLVRLKDGQIPFSHFAWITPLVNGQTYVIKVQTIDNRIIVFLNGQVIIDTIDLSYNQNGGKISIKAGTGAAYPTRVRFDNIVVKSIDPENGKQLNVAVQKQTDPAWKDEEYDHASRWSPAMTTMGRWGCAVASASMILNYHGINKLADGSAMTPLSLNNWLKSQTDGFIDGLKSGYVNWIAVTRLTRELSEKYQTTKLETARKVGTELFKIVTEEIDQSKPSILEIAGHFLVGSGYTADRVDLFVKDPAFSLNLFSQHQTQLKSVRTFQPSHTDLSYLLLSHDPSLKVQLTALDGSAVAGLQEYEESIKDPTAGSIQTMPSTIIHELAKPSGGQYLLKISRSSFGPFNLQFFSYDIQANPTNLSQSGWAGPVPLVYVVNYQREAGSTLQPQHSLTQWRAQLKNLWETKQLYKSYAYAAIDRIARLGEAQPVSKQGRYLNSLRQLLKQYQNAMTADSRQFLEQQL